MGELGAGEILLAVILGAILSFQFLPFYLSALYIFIATYLCYSRLRQLNNYWSNQGIDGPKPNLLFGNALALKEGFQKFDIENYRKFGPIFGTSLLGKPDLVVADLSFLKEVLVKDFAHFCNRRTQYCVRSNVNIINHMLPTMKCQRWKSVRSTISPTFSSGKIKKVLPVVRWCVTRALQRADDCINNNQGCIDAMQLCGALTMDVIGRVAFGIQPLEGDSRESVFIHYCNKSLNFTFTDIKLIIDALFPNIMSATEDALQRTIFDNDCNEFFKNAVRDMIREREKHPRKEDPDFLQLILNTMENPEEESASSTEDDEEEQIFRPSRLEKVRLEDIEIAAQCFLFLIAGYETTASTMQFALFSLAHHQHIQQRAYEEIVRIVGDKSEISYEDLSKMDYVKQIMFETLRMYPPAPRFDRECASEVSVRGIRFEKNCVLSVPLYAIHYDQKYYPNPENFDPQRFSAEAVKSREPLAFLPFGIGPRDCLGKRFAILEFQLAIAYFLRRFHFTVGKLTPSWPIKLSTAGMTKPAERVILELVQRRPPMKDSPTRTT